MATFILLASLDDYQKCLEQDSVPRKYWAIWELSPFVVLPHLWALRL